MDPAKIQAICDWPTPQKIREIQSFLGFANLYRRFIAEYSNMTVPLTRLTRKDAKWTWTPACEEAFGLLKESFILAPILHHFDPSLPPIVKTNASDYTIAGILSVWTTTTSTRLHTTAAPSPEQSLTTICTTKNSLLSSRPSRSGATTSNHCSTLSTSLRTTRTWNTSLRRSCSPDVKLDGQNTYPPSTWSFA